MSELRIKFIANPTQRQFIESRAQADLFSSRKGEGKSAALVWSCFYHTRANPGANWVFIRDTYENLRKTTLQEFLRWFPSGLFGKYNAGNKVYTWDEAKTGMRGQVFFMGLDDDAAAGRLASMPLAGFAIDEPSGAAAEGAQGVSELVFDTALAQLRQPGMRWYAAKLAQNNPDEGHWTYRRFVEPGMPGNPSIVLLPEQTSGFVSWQTVKPENTANLPPSYYESLAQQWAHRPDLVRRFVDGKFGFQQAGRAVTPEWKDEIHLAPKGLTPVKGVPLWIGYDGGHTPTAVICQLTPMGTLLVLDSYVGHETGMFELIRDVVRPRLATRYAGFEWKHVGDPNLATTEQSSRNQSAAQVITRELGGMFIKGVADVRGRVDPLREILRRMHGGQAAMLVDKLHAREIWWALRGGWHYHVNRSGTVGQIVKDMHSHPGDAISYVVAHLFPLGALKKTGSMPHYSKGKPAVGYDRAPKYKPVTPGNSLGMALKKGQRLPHEMRTLPAQRRED